MLPCSPYIFLYACVNLCVYVMVHITLYIIHICTTSQVVGFRQCQQNKFYNGLDNVMSSSRRTSIVLLMLSAGKITGPKGHGGQGKRVLLYRGSNGVSEGARGEKTNEATLQNRRGSERGGFEGYTWHVDVLTVSLVERRVDGNLKVVVVEAGGWVQDRQHVLQRGRQRCQDITE